MEQFQEHDFVFKLMLAGNVNVGKSCLFVRFLKDEFRSKHVETVGVEFGAKTLLLPSPAGSKRVKLQLWDTAGHERYKSMASSYYRGANGILLVYDLTDQSSFYQLDDWIQLIRACIPLDTLPVIVLANKSDSAERAVSASDGAAFARKHGFQHREVSAKTGAGVKEAFQDLAKKVLKRATQEKQPGEAEPSRAESVRLAGRGGQGRTKRGCEC